MKNILPVFMALLACCPGFSQKVYQKDITLCNHKYTVVAQLDGNKLYLGVFEPGKPDKPLAQEVLKGKQLEAGVEQTVYTTTLHQLSSYCKCADGGQSTEAARSFAQGFSTSALQQLYNKPGGPLRFVDLDNSERLELMQTSDGKYVISVVNTYGPATPKVLLSCDCTNGTFTLTEANFDPLVISTLDKFAALAACVPDKKCIPEFSLAKDDYNSELRLMAYTGPASAGPSNVKIPPDAGKRFQGNEKTYYLTSGPKKVYLIKTEGILIQ